MVHRLLRPGGVLYLAEIHPMVFGAGRRRAHPGPRHPSPPGTGRTPPPGGTYAVPDAELSNTVTFERTHAVSEVLTAVLDSGLTVELVREHSYTNAPWPWTVRGDDGFFRLAPGGPGIPLAYSVRARKPA